MKRTTKRIITISSVLVVILALLCTGVSLYINSIFDRIEKIPEVSRVDPSNEFFETDSPEESPTTAPVVKPEDIGWGEIEPFSLSGKTAMSEQLGSVQIQCFSAASIQKRRRYQ